MKMMKLIGLGLLIAAIPFASEAQNKKEAKYLAAMKSAVAIVDTCETKDVFLSVQEKFSHIASQRKTDWLPYYYIAFCYTHVAMMNKVPDSIEYYTQLADQAITMSDSLNKKNAELYCLKALNTIAKIDVDFMKRGLQYSSLANKMLDEAQKIDSANPRVYYLKGRFLYGRPVQFGGGKKAAKPWFEKAVAAYAAHNDRTSIYPHWGDNLANRLLLACKED